MSIGGAWGGGGGRSLGWRRREVINPQNYGFDQMKALDESWSRVLTPCPCFRHPAPGLDLASFPMARPPSLCLLPYWSGLFRDASCLVGRPPVFVALPPTMALLIYLKSYLVIHCLLLDSEVMQVMMMCHWLQEKADVEGRGEGETQGLVPRQGWNTE
ncbi:hypothetical protein EYF80_023229 [Liparis tanakae]|uniref:Uncharacterized protein n=1 Tax=Liparis tanakae TaxID=230148 RepID=A0A4Z2HNI3_9TELE|nr:hypothetical protein EYF80_023229 [Liparis tanakae]